MDRARVSPFPHYSWLGFAHAAARSHGPAVVHARHVTHRVIFATAGRAAVRWITRGHQQRFEMECGQVCFHHADGLEHTFEIVPEDTLGMFMLLIPAGHLRGIAGPGGMVGAFAAETPPIIDDASLRTSMRTFAHTDSGPDIVDTTCSETAARSLVARLSELLGGETPNWHTDSSSLTRHAMERVTKCIDLHLHRRISLDELAAVCDLSPSHFARKFRMSAGVSLQRFVNRRRLRAALALLLHGTVPLPRIALDLGFSSQSHFTRLFSGATGFTPASLRRAVAGNATTARATLRDRNDP